jgi:hypothetical protein
MLKNDLNSLIKKLSNSILNNFHNSHLQAYSRVFLTFFLILASENALACLERAVEKLNADGPPSDTPYTVRDMGLWPANSPIYHPMNQKLLAEYNFKTHHVQYTGSFHSGWFQGLVIMKDESCEFVEFLNTYSE